MRYIRLVIAAVLLLPGLASALSLDEAQMIAREQATTLQTLEAETRQAEARHTQTAQAFLPTLSADASWLRADSAAINAVPASLVGGRPNQTVDFGPVEGAVTGLQLVQPVFNADALRQREAASLKVDARRQARQWGQQALRLEVARRYFNILRLQNRQQAAEQAREAARQAAQMAEGSYQQGMVARLDVEQAQAELAAAQARISQTKAATQGAEYQLKSLLGMAPGQPLQLDTGLPEPAMPLGINKQSAPRKDLEAHQLAAKAADRKTRAAEGEWLPRINLLARQQWAHGDQQLEDNADGWLVAVNLQWTLFDGLGREGRIAEARADAEKARTELEETRRRIDREQAIAASQWQAGFHAWQAAGKSVEAAKTAARLANRRYQENLGSMTDLLAARARLDRERATLIDSRYQAVLAAMNHHLQHGRDPLLALGNSYQ